jgi:hypothetical protein
MKESFEKAKQDLEYVLTGNDNTISLADEVAEMSEIFKKYQ